MTNRKRHGIIFEYNKEEQTPFSPDSNLAVVVNTFATYIVWLVCVRRVFLRIFHFLEVFFISTKDTTLINDDIRAKEVRVIGADGEQIGILPLADAKELAYDKGLDLVLLSPQAEPPVCRIMDYGKYRFEKEKKQKEAKKKQQIVKVKEIQLSCRIDTHDFETRANHARKFLEGGDKVKVIVRFKGREMAHQDIGRAMLEKFIAACADVGASEKGISLDGRFMSTIIAPSKK